MSGMQRLQDWLDEHGKTQLELAKEMRCSQPTVSDWINGNTKPSADNLIALSQLTGVSIDGLLKEHAHA